jgi:predicted TIM-barrel fold metal-dependent hydrolase
MMVDITEADRHVYERELKEFLPGRIFDAHVHVLDRTCLRPGYQCPPRNIMAKFGGVFTLEQCHAWARAILPEQEYHLNSFGMPSFDSDLDASAVYSGRIADNRRSFAMALVAPRDSREAVIRRVEENRLIGYKPYLEFVEGKRKADITIHDMLPAPQMEAADERGLAIMLHIPRPERLPDPVNQTQMVEICRGYPQTKIIFAHIGRAYYLRNVIGMLDGIAACPNAYIDTSMVNHEGVLEYALRNFPRDRILFGSDAPVACLHGKSVEINNQYAYLMAEDYEIGTSIYDARQAVNFTTFFHEQLRGIKLAAERAGLSRAEIEDLFFNNAQRLFSAVAERNYGKGS